MMAIQRHLGAVPMAFRLCAMGGCKNKIRARGICRSHYMAAWRKGNLAIAPKRGPEKMVLLSIWVPDAMVSRVRKIARLTGQTYSDIVRDALRPLGP